MKVGRKSSQTHFQRIEPTRGSRKPELQEQYKRLAKQPLWRLFKVSFTILSLVLVMRAIVGVWNSVCSESVQCNTPSAAGNGIAGGVGALLGLAMLFWLIRRLTAYIVYGSTKQK
jgi:hypothetical protein